MPPPVNPAKNDRRGQRNSRKELYVQEYSAELVSAQPAGPVTLSAPTPLATLDDRVRYAKTLADAGLLPTAYRGRPANVLVAIETGAMLGLAPMAAIQNVHVIEGKPSYSAGLLAALVRRAGHTIRVTGTDEKAVAEIVRADDPDFTYRAEWTIARARQAQLLSKDNWKKYPAAMLKSRAVSEVCRDACQDVFLGPVYVAEELGATVDADGDPVTAPATTEPDQQPAAGGDEPVDADVVDEQPASVAPVSPYTDEDWDEARAELADRGTAEQMLDLWNAAKLADCGQDVLDRIVADGKRMRAAEQSEGGEQA